MKPIVSIVRRVVITLILVAVLAIGGILGLSRMGTDVLPPHQMRQLHAYAAYSGRKAMQAKAFIVGKFGSFHHTAEESHHDPVWKSGR